MYERFLTIEPNLQQCLPSCHILYVKGSNNKNVTNYVRKDGLAQTLYPAELMLALALPLLPDKSKS